MSSRVLCNSWCILGLTFHFFFFNIHEIKQELQNLRESNILQRDLIYKYVNTTFQSGWRIIHIVKNNNDFATEIKTQIKSLTLSS